MASYFSSLLTTTTSRVATLRQNLLPTENDGDTPEDSHLCRVLRAYYTEKGRGFPGWLPPDPKAPQQQAIQQPVYASSVGAGYGGGGLAQAGAGGAAAGGRQGGLAGLWGDKSAAASPAPASLRAQGRPNAGLRTQSGPERQQAPVGNPLPSARADSQQGFRPQGRAPAAANYEDSFAPAAGQYGSRAAPAMRASEPWADSGSGYEGGGGGYSDGAARQPPRQGLPSGPRRGLPSGPKGGLPAGPRGYR